MRCAGSWAVPGMVAQAAGRDAIEAGDITASTDEGVAADEGVPDETAS